MLRIQHFALHDVEDYSPARFMRMLEDGRVVLLFDGFDELVVRSTYARAAEHFETIVSAARGRAKVVVTSNPGCILQIRAGLEKSGVKVMHIADYLAESLEPQS